MTSRAYCRCNSGHLFEGEFCPFDGWSSAASKAIASAVKKLNHAGVRVSLAELRKAGVSAASLKRAVVMEFGSPDSAFEALSPEEIVVDGQVHSLLQVGAQFK